MNAVVDRNKILDRLDRLSPWAFTGALYLARWLVILVTLVIDGLLVTFLAIPMPDVRFEGTPFMLFVGMIVLSPFIETLMECSFPYWVMKSVGMVPRESCAWGFVIVSATIMVLLHLFGGLLAILPSLVTGGFLAYTYAHFATKSFPLALLHTFAFHAAIDIVGWTQIASGIFGNE